MKTILFAATILLIMCSEVRAQEGVDYQSATAQGDAVAGAPRNPMGLAARVLGDRGGYQYIIVRRDESGEVEVHERWDDIDVVQEGSGIVLIGGTYTGGRTTAPGETRGGELTGAVAHRVAAGDVLVIPAGLPHQVTVEPGGSITYFVVKAESVR